MSIIHCSKPARGDYCKSQRCWRTFQTASLGRQSHSATTSSGSSSDSISSTFVTSRGSMFMTIFTSARDRKARNKISGIVKYSPGLRTNTDHCCINSPIGLSGDKLNTNFLTSCYMHREPGGGPSKNSKLPRGGRPMI